MDRYDKKFIINNLYNLHKKVVKLEDKINKKINYKKLIDKFENKRMTDNNDYISFNLKDWLIFKDNFK